MIGTQFVNIVCEQDLVTFYLLFTWFELKLKIYLVTKFVTLLCIQEVEIDSSSILGLKPDYKDGVVNPIS